VVCKVHTGYGAFSVLLLPQCDKVLWFNIPFNVIGPLSRFNRRHALGIYVAQVIFIGAGNPGLVLLLFASHAHVTSYAEFRLIQGLFT
jgi:hypothetical protein